MICFEVVLRYATARTKNITKMTLLAFNFSTIYFQLRLVMGFCFVSWLTEGTYLIADRYIHYSYRNSVCSLRPKRNIFIHSIGVCRMRRFLAVLRTFFHSSLLCTFFCHHSPRTILSPSLTSSCHLILGLPLSLVVTKFIYNTLLGILFFSLLCTGPN